MKTGFKVCMAAVAVVACMAASAGADDFFKQVATTAPFEMMGESVPAMVDTSVTWVSPDCVYNRTSQAITIARFDLGVIYTLDPSARTYTEIPMEAMTDFSEMLSQIAGEDEEFARALEEYKKTGSAEILEEARAELEDDPEMAEMLEGVLQMLIGFGDSSHPAVTAVVTPTDEYRNFGPWKARKYFATMTMPMMDGIESEIWATEDFGVNYDRFMKTCYGMAASWPGFSEAMEEFRKVKGMAVYSTVNMSVFGAQMEVTSELIEHMQTTPPKGIYEIPDGFTKVSLGAFGSDF
ncbi:MAG: hypothetical protein JSU65_06950 [Candidatus Zixiibacteriota bacterium]|nr:MAG: hypothetical protein JSU65_06950 [candidate division Zixibacteria bacterium]